MAKKKIEIQQEITLLRITNPLWIETLGPQIKIYWEATKKPGMTFEALLSYFVGIVQYGGEVSDFWVAFKDNRPVGFSIWTIMGPPYFGVAHCDQLHVWEDDPRISRMLMDKFVEWAALKRCPYIHALLVNGKVSDHFKAMGDDMGLDVTDAGTVELFARRRVN
jgi:hypothetical protein